MLSLEETTVLVDLLQSADTTLLEIADRFSKSFKPESFSRLALSLRCLLEDNYSSPSGDSSGKDAAALSWAAQSELLITYFLLYLIAIHPVGHTDEWVRCPNTWSVLYEQLQKLEGFIRDRRKKKEESKGKMPSDLIWSGDEAVRSKTVLKFFILQCITGEMKDAALKKKVEDILGADMQFLESEFDKLGRDAQSLRDKLKQLHTAFEDERRNPIGGFLGKGISPKISLPCDYSVDVGDMPHKPSMNVKRFEPIIERPRPPPLPFFSTELSFLHSDGIESDLWIDPMVNPPSWLELRELMLKSFSARLNQDQTMHVINLLKTDDSLLFHVGLSPHSERLQALVHHNPVIAEHCLKELVQTPHSAEFLSSLVKVQLTLQSMELVSKLTPSLPKPLLHTYISNIISAAQTATDLQTRHVRLVCVWLTNLVRLKTMTEQELFETTQLGVEMLEFCTKFTTIKEASSLYRVLVKMSPNADADAEK